MDINSANFQIIGRNVVCLPKCHSTNDYATELLKSEKVEEGTVIFTDHQYAGKGQRGSSWESEPGLNLTFSVIIRPDFLHLNKHFYLNIFTCLGILDCLIPIIREGLSVKWPNDIYYLNKKAGGILIQNSIQSNRFEHSVIGIGLNINQVSFNAGNAISLSSVTGELFDLDNLLNQLLSGLDKRYGQLASGQEQLLKRDYLERLYRINEEHDFIGPGKFRGIITGIDDEGRLKILIDEKIHVFNMKEIKFAG